MLHLSDRSRVRKGDPVMTKIFGFRSAWIVPAFAAILLPSGAATQQVQLLAGGDTEWSRLPYNPVVAYTHNPGGFLVPYLNLEENLDKIRAKTGTEELDNPRSHHLQAIQYDLEFATEQEEWRHAFQRTRELIQSADIAFVNLEMPISDRAQRRETASVGAVAYADALAWAGFDVISIANNRTLDAETTGLLDTREALSRAGIGAVGGGRNLKEARLPYIVERNGLKVAFLAYTYGVSWVGVDGFARPGGAGVMAMDPFLIKEDIRRVRDKVDFVALSFHWGVGSREPPQDIPEEARKFAREMIDAGADVIIGHHSHVPKGVEVYKGGVILYSVANFAFGHSHDYFTDNYLARLTLERGSIPRMELLPMAGKGKDVGQPYVLRGERAQQLLRDVQELSRRLDTELTIEGDIGVIRPGPLRMTGM
jgi:poly-gamma-glutamate synthesis protein (capsule biosynthesis protein)